MQNGRGNDAFTRAVARDQEEKSREERRRAHAAKLTGAHTTSPIKDMAMVEKWMRIAKAHDARRERGGVSWYMLLLLGFNTGLRIGDLCKLRVRDVRGRERVRIIAEKTDKMTDVMLQMPVRRRIDHLLQDLDGNDWVLQSRQTDRRSGREKPVSRQRCHGIVKEIAAEAGFEGHVGCHTLRKTFAWQYYQTCGDLAELQKVLNHSSQEATIHYLGLDQEKIDETISRMPTMV